MHAGMEEWRGVQIAPGRPAPPYDMQARRGQDEPQLE